MQRVLVAIAALWCGNAVAAPPPPLEALLGRAETVILVTVKSASDKSITFERGEVLRGAADAEMTLAVDSPCPGGVQFDVGSRFLLVSQGDLRFGAPRPVVGRCMHGQGSWCGWTPLPIRAVGEELYAERILSFADPTAASTDAGGVGLSLARIRRLVARFPYDAHINDEV